MAILKATADTFQLALRSVQPGDRIQVRPGVHQMPAWETFVHGTREAPIVIEGVGGHPSIEGGDEYPVGSIIKHDWYILRHFSLRKWSYPLRIHGAKHVTLFHGTVEDCIGAGIIGRLRCGDVFCEGLTIRSIRRKEGTPNGEGLYFGTYSRNRFDNVPDVCSNIVVKDSEIYECESDGVDIKDDCLGVYLINVYSHHNSVDGFTISCDQARVKRCKAEDNAEHGFQVNSHAPNESEGGHPVFGPDYAYGNRNWFELNESRRNGKYGYHYQRRQLHYSNNVSEANALGDIWEGWAA